MVEEILIEEKTRETTLEEEFDASALEIEPVEAVPRRLASIDFVKGIAIIFIIIAHVAAAWLDEQWIFIYGFVYAFLDILGPSLFIFLSALSVVFSINRKKGHLPKKAIRNTIFSRGLSMLLIGSLINFALNGADLPFPSCLWGWNIISFIGLSQIVCYYTIKLKRSTRIVIGVIIIFTSEMIREAIWSLSRAEPIFYALWFALDSPEATTTILPWIAVCFITTVFGELLYEAMMDGSDKSYRHLFRVFVLWGGILFVFGIITGLETVLPTLGNINGNLYKFDVYYAAIKQPFVYYPGMWKFLVRGTFSNIWYTMGTSFLIVAAAFYLTDIKKKDNILIGMIKFYGTVSLNLFLMHYLLTPFFSAYMTILVLPYILVTYIGLLGVLFHIWYRYWDGMFSPEWLMQKISSIGVRNKSK
ncbi:MAG: heparan-alpha-glucosaminide N-acetyltransferase domain-containing protein [Promethearchaeota archaeon]